MEMELRLGVLAALLATGCSFVAVSTPRERPAPPLRCETESAAPVLDAVAGALALTGGGAISIYDLTTRSELQGVATAVIGLPLLGIGTLYGLSATYGFVQTRRCRRFHRELGIPVGAGPAPR
jgi:hypothetical protein